MYVEQACLFLLSALCTVSSEQVIGLLGSTVTLPCHMRRDLLDAGLRSRFPVPSVHWKRNSRSVFRVTPSGITYTAHTAATRALVPQSDIESGVFSLQLKDLKEEDAGIYDGVAQYGDSTHKCRVTLRIIKVTQSVSGLLPENGAVNLTCAVIGPQKSMYSYRWIHGGVTTFPANRITKAGSTLYIQRLTSEDNGEWTCEVDGARASLMLRVLSILVPPHLSIYASIGSHVKLPCNVSEVPEEWSLSLQWSKATGSISSDDPVLIFDNVMLDDAGTYRCDITYRGQLITRHITIKVIQVFTLGPSFVKEGSSLSLTCNVTGEAEGEEYEWTGPLNTTKSHNARKGAVLNLPAVYREDSGSWVCTVYGNNGIQGTAEQWIHVLGAQTAELGSFSSWQTYIVFLLCLLLIAGLMLIMGISLKNRRRRLSHLAALAKLNSLPTQQPKKVSVDQ